MINGHVATQAWHWVASVVYQGERVLDLQRRMIMPRDEKGLLEWGKIYRQGPDFSHIEDHYFVTSVSKSVEWLAEALKRNLITPDVAESFIAAAGDVKVVRNILEHQTEYVDGGGRQRSKNVVSVPIDDQSNVAKTDASSVLITDTSRILGGRIDVQKMISEANAIVPKLHEAAKAAIREDGKLNVPQL